MAVFGIDSSTSPRRIPWSSLLGAVVVAIGLGVGQPLVVAAGVVLANVRTAARGLRALRPGVARRSGRERTLLAVGVLVTTGLLGGAAATAYAALRLGEIERVEDLTLQDASGGPANYLLVGTDSRAGLDLTAPDAETFVGGGEKGCDCTDTIIVVRIDPGDRTARLLSIPRDLYVPIADDGRRSRINTAHAKGEQVLIDTIRDALDLTIHHYVEVDFVGFERLVDAIDGVPLYFEEPIRDRKVGLEVGAGCSVLDGTDARRFARSRALEHQDERGRWRSDPTADFGRITRQQIFLRRALSKAVSKGLGNPLVLDDLVAAGVQSVRLDEDLDASDLASLARRFRSFDAGELQGFTLPTTSLTTEEGAAVQVLEPRAAEPVLNVFRGRPPGDLDPATIAVPVANGSAVASQADDAAGALRELGFAASVERPVAPTARTTVTFGPGGEDVARTVARHVTGGAAITFDRRLAPFTVRLTVGDDFTTVHELPAPPGSPEDLATAAAITHEPPAPPPGYGTGEPPPGVTCG